ncbi:uncharacterized protein [Macrobrachium rosenbergii]|uniref:uncharacterized protein n=1 Tax=Macrobrachium rosenbergii TaxID=79674 RepID=UPI0034D6CE76
MNLLRRFKGQTLLENKRVGVMPRVEMQPELGREETTGRIINYNRREGYNQSNMPEYFISDRLNFRQKLGQSNSKVLLIGLALDASYAQVNIRPFLPDNSRGDIAFPGDPGFPAAAINRFVEPVTTVRAAQRPGCTMNSPDPSAPCVEDQEYNDSIRYKCLLFNGAKSWLSRLLARSRSVNEIVSDPGISVILNDVFSSGPLPRTTLTTPPLPSGIEPSTRFGGPRETPACVSREELIFPQRAKTPKNDWVFVVNQEGVKQALRVERCHKEGEPCNIGIPITGDVTTVCRQKYVYRRMLVVGSNQIEPEEVLMPSCCVCYVRRNNLDIPSARILMRNTFDISSRTGTGNATSAAAGAPQPQPQPSDVQPGGNPIGFGNPLPPEHVSHNIRRSSGGYFYHPLYRNNGGR